MEMLITAVDSPALMHLWQRRWALFRDELAQMSEVVSDGLKTVHLLELQALGESHAEVVSRLIYVKALLLHTSLGAGETGVASQPPQMLRVPTLGASDRAGHRANAPQSKNNRTELVLVAACVWQPVQWWLKTGRNCSPLGWSLPMLTYGCIVNWSHHTNTGFLLRWCAATTHYASEFISLRGEHKWHTTPAANLALMNACASCN